VTVLVGPLGAQQYFSLRAVRRPAPPTGSHVPGEVIVGFAVADDFARVERALRSVGGVSARRSLHGGRFLVTLEEGQGVAEAVARLSAMPEVEYAEPNGIVSAFLTPDDPEFELQWHMRQLGAERTWDIQSGDPSVAVAILDTGVAFEDFGPFRRAPDFGNTVFLRGFNVFDGSAHANDDNFHGTHVASTVAEATNNGLGAVGLAFGCALMPVKVLDAEGTGTFFGVAEGIDYVVNFRQDGVNPVKVINLSLGGDFVSTTLGAAIDRAVDAGITVVAAAGNDGSRGIAFPASHARTIAVGATNARRERAVYSNTGPELDVLAPGGNVDRDDDQNGFPDGVLQQTFDPFTAAAFGRYDDFDLFFVDGTSQAAPHVAAIAALLYTQGITDPDAVRESIRSTAEDLGPEGKDDETGYGLAQPARALSGLGLNQ